MCKPWILLAFLLAVLRVSVVGGGRMQTGRWMEGRTGQVDGWMESDRQNSGWMDGRRQTGQVGGRTDADSGSAGMRFT